MSSFYTDNRGRIIAYTDGACPNNGFGAYRAGIGVYFGPGNQYNLSERLNPRLRQTNNVVEIEAARRAVEQTKKAGYTGHGLRIRTDSEFLTKSMNEWINNWKRNGWRTANHQPVQNRENFEALEREIGRMDVVFEHVSREENQEADALAKKGANM